MPESIDVEHGATVQMPPKSRTATVVVTREAWDALLARVTALESALIETRTALIDSNNHIIRLQSLISGKLAQPRAR